MISRFGPQGSGKLTTWNATEDAAIQAYINNAIAYVSAHPGAPLAGAIYATAGTTQAKATGIPPIGAGQAPAVPEPSTWAMMIFDSRNWLHGLSGEGQTRSSSPSINPVTFGTGFPCVWLERRIRYV